MVCQYWFFNHRFDFQDYVCNGCHDLTMLCLNISDITILLLLKVLLIFVFIHDVSKFEAMHLLKTSVLEGRGYI